MHLFALVVFITGRLNSLASSFHLTASTMGHDQATETGAQYFQHEQIDHQYGTLLYMAPEICAWYSLA